MSKFIMKGFFLVKFLICFLFSFLVYLSFRIDLIYENPNFIDVENLNFNYLSDSPCIDAGNPNLFDSDGSIRDIGANTYQEILNGDCNQDLELSVLDVVYLINNCILFQSGDCSCSDINQDGESNVLDVVTLVNLILT